MLYILIYAFLLIWNKKYLLRVNTYQELSQINANLNQVETKTSRKYNGFVNLIVQMAREEGVKSLWKGIWGLYIDYSVISSEATL